MNQHFSFLLKHYPETKVFARFKHDGEILTTHWVAAKDWYSLHKTDPTDYVILANEIVLETDFSTKEENEKYFYDTVKPKLDKEKISYIAGDSGNKSFHVHIQYDQELTGYQKVRIVEDLFPGHPFDKNLLSNTHGVRLFSAKHPETGKPKVRVVKVDGLNSIDLSRYPKVKEDKGIFINVDKNTRLKDCPVLSLALKMKFPQGARHTVLIPNFLALHPTDEEMNQFCKTQGMNVSELKGWLDSNKFQARFSCKQIKYHYAEYHDQCINRTCLQGQKR